MTPLDPQSLDPQPLAPAVAAAEEAGWAVLRLDLDGVRSKAELMRRCGAALRVPEYFGANWDALADALGDLSWLPAAPGRVVAVTSWAEFAGARPEEWQTLQEVLEGAVEAWRDVEDGAGALRVVVAQTPPSGRARRAPRPGPKPRHEPGPKPSAEG